MNLKPTYFSFMVRIWREPNLVHPEQRIGAWQGEVEHVQTGDRWSFEDVETLLAFLRAQMEDRDSEG